MKAKRRIVSLLLCGTMLFSLCSQSVLAEASAQDSGNAELEETATPSNAEKASAVERVQAMIDALPEKITADNAEDVKAQLEAIDEAKAELTDEELDQLDITRYIEAAAALGGLDTPVLLDAALSGTFGRNNDWSWTLDDSGTLTITGTGDMPDFEHPYVGFDASPWDSSEEQITKVVITSGVTSIGNFAFFEHTNLTSAELPSGLTFIGQYAFSGCTNLALTELPSSLISIAYGAFDGCTGLALTKLPDGVTSIGNYAFFDCTSLALTELPSGVTSIADCAFKGCTSLTELTFTSSTALRLENVYLIAATT